MTLSMSRLVSCFLMTLALLGSLSSSASAQLSCGGPLLTASSPFRVVICLNGNLVAVIGDNASIGDNYGGFTVTHVDTNDAFGRIGLGDPGIPLEIGIPAEYTIEGEVLEAVAQNGSASSAGIILANCTVTRLGVGQNSSSFQVLAESNTFSPMGFGAEAEISVGGFSGSVGEIQHAGYYRTTPSGPVPGVLTNLAATLIPLVLPDPNIDFVERLPSPPGTFLPATTVGLATTFQLNLPTPTDPTPSLTLPTGARVFLGARPLGDTCDSAEELPFGCFGSVNATDWLYFLPDGESSCDSILTRDRWFSFTAPADGLLLVTTCGTHDCYLVDTVLGLFESCGGVELACNDNAPCPYTDSCDCLTEDTGFPGDATVTLQMTQGETVKVRVSLRSYGELFGLFLGTVFIPDTPCQTLPPNDDCGDAISIGVGATTFANMGATLDGPTDADADMTGDVWYRYTNNSGATKQVQLSTCSTASIGPCPLDDTVLIVYDGTMCPLAPDFGLASDDDTCGVGGLSSELTISIASGDSILIQVGGANGLEGIGTLTVTAAGRFIRGDANSDGGMDISDGIFILDYLFVGGGTPACRDAADVNDDGTIDLSDFLYLAVALFVVGGSPPPPPYPSCGDDPTPDFLDCINGC